MRLCKSSQAGTLESSDMLVAVAPAPAGSGISITLASPTMRQYGDHIKSLTLGILKSLDVTDATVDINDKGAVDFVIVARVRTAVMRAMEA